MRNDLSSCKNLITFLLNSFLFFFPLFTQATPQTTLNYQLTPYLWATGQQGTIEWLKGPGNGITINQRFADIWRRMDKGGMAYFELQNDKGGLLLDGIYLKISDHDSFSFPKTAISLQGNGHIIQQLYSIAGFFKSNITPQTRLDTLMGVRYNIIEADIFIQLTSFALANISRHFTGQKSWLNPYIGLRISHQFNSKWTLLGYIDAGGTNLNRKVTWQIAGGIHYTFKRNLVGKLGYRYLSNHYQQGSFYYHINTSGPYLGLGINW